MYKLDDLKPVRKMWVKMANIPTGRLGWVLDDCTEVDELNIKRIRSWLYRIQNGEIIKASGETTCGKGLLLWGEPGHGKTTLSVSIIQEMMTTFPLSPFAVEEGRVLNRPCYFATFNDILALNGMIIGEEASLDQQTLFKGMLGDCENDAYNIRVLIVDDLGKEHTTLSGWQSNTFHHLLRTRFNHGLPTIVTTNIKLENWASSYGDATESFANEAFYYLPMVAEDLRK